VARDVLDKHILGLCRQRLPQTERFRSSRPGLSSRRRWVPAGFVIGPNDITFDRKGTALYVTNAGLNTVVKIEVQKDGTAGAITDFAVGIPTPDGLAFDQGGTCMSILPLPTGFSFPRPMAHSAHFRLTQRKRALATRRMWRSRGPSFTSPTFLSEP
jgi:sugar lactone lactonase YvrE